MMYLCEQHGGRLLGSSHKERADMLTFLFFQMVSRGGSLPAVRHCPDRGLT